MEKFNQARVNGGSNYDSLKVAKCLVGETAARDGLTLEAGITAEGVLMVEAALVAEVACAGAGD